MACVSPGLDGSQFFKMADQSIDFNVSACCTFRMIEFSVSIHACVWPRNAKEIVATTYPHEMCKKDAHKWGGGLHNTHL